MAVQSAAMLRASPFRIPNITKQRLSFTCHQSFAFRSNTHLRRASSRSPNFSQEGAHGEDDLVSGARIWSRTISSVYGVDREYGDEEDHSDEEEDRSLDLLVRFVQNMFRKISRRARRAVRSVLPLSIPTELVGFSVNGVLVLAFLWILKAFLEYLLVENEWHRVAFDSVPFCVNSFFPTLNILRHACVYQTVALNVSSIWSAGLKVVCTLGSVVFVSILLIRGIWTGLTYLQEARHHKLNGLDDDPRAWTNAQPVS